MRPTATDVEDDEDDEEGDGDDAGPPNPRDSGDGEYAVSLAEMGAVAAAMRATASRERISTRSAVTRP